MASRTALYETHLALGAKVIDFGGWDMPVDYPTHILQEHFATRQNAGLFDTGHMGEVLIEGPGALDSLQAAVSRDLDGMEDGQGRYTLLCNERGTVIDDLIVFKQADAKYYIVTNAGTRINDIAVLQSRLKNATLTDLTPQTHKLDLQGPKTFDIMSQLCSEPLSKLKRFRMINTTVAGVPAIVSRSGYTGEKNGVELFFAKSEAVHVWNAIMEAGKPFGVLPCGLGARDTLRLECCLPLYGHELSEDISPLEAGLKWAMTLEKEFVGAAALRAQERDGIPRTLVALKFAGRLPARAGHSIFVGDDKIGEVTSGTFGPSVNSAIALALVRTGSAPIGATVQAEVRTSRIDAVVVEKPFYKPAK
ncbi:MAG: glycine cleavage system aminomethyltransferase GcvT [Planctomycetota bacterium]